MPITTAGTKKEMISLNKKVIAITAVVALVIIGTVAASVVFFLNREGVAVNTGTFSATSGSVGFTFGVEAEGRNGISNVSNNTWRATPYSANGNSRVDYTFTAANLEAMTVRSTNSEGRISLEFIQGDIERTFDITGDFYENVDMNGFEPGRIRLRLVYENTRDVDVLIRW